MATENMAESAAAVVRGKQRATVRGVELACEFLGPVIRSTNPQDPRILAALEALEAVCAVRRRRQRR